MSQFSGISDQRTGAVSGWVMPSSRKIHRMVAGLVGNVPRNILLLEISRTREVVGRFQRKLERVDRF